MPIHTNKETQTRIFALRYPAVKWIMNIVLKNERQIPTEIKDDCWDFVRRADSMVTELDKTYGESKERNDNNVDT